MYRDEERISPEGGDRGRGHISPDGLVVWEAGRDVYLEQENFSEGLLGSGRFAYSLGFAGESPLWYGYGSLQSGLFVGKFNLSADAGIPNAPTPEAWATNQLGDVLWLYKEYIGGSYRYNLWLSTLVPEPSPLPPLALILLAICRRRRR